MDLQRFSSNLAFSLLVERQVRRKGNMEEFQKIKEAAKSLQEILEKDYDPMHKIVISSQDIEIIGRVAGIPTESVCVGTFDSTTGYFFQRSKTNKTNKVLFWNIKIYPKVFVFKPQIHHILIPSNGINCFALVEDKRVFQSQLLSMAACKLCHV